MSGPAPVSAPDRIVIRQLLEANRIHDDRLALLLFSGDMMLYALCLSAALVSPSPAQFPAGILAGVVALRLAAIAHDAAHQSLTSNRRWNRFIGRIAFLPSLQPLATWEVAHNYPQPSKNSREGGRQ